jgi:hypothetical protein
MGLTGGIQKMELADAFEDLEKCNPFMLKIEGKPSGRAPRDGIAFAALQIPASLTTARNKGA